MDPLQQFFETPAIKEAVKAYLLEELATKAIEAVFQKKSTAGIYEANRVIEDCFRDGEKRYQQATEKKVIDNSR